MQILIKTLLCCICGNTFVNTHCLYTHVTFASLVRGGAVPPIVFLQLKVVCADFQFQEFYTRN